MINMLLFCAVFESSADRLQIHKDWHTEHRTGQVVTRRSLVWFGLRGTWIRGQRVDQRLRTMCLWWKVVGSIPSSSLMNSLGLDICNCQTNKMYRSVALQKSSTAMGRNSGHLLVQLQASWCCGVSCCLQVTQPGILKLSDLQEGTYVFRMTITDTAGQRSSDNVTVTVLPQRQQPEGEPAPISRPPPSPAGVM